MLKTSYRIQFWNYASGGCSGEPISKVCTITVAAGISCNTDSVVFYSLMFRYAVFNYKLSVGPVAGGWGGGGTYKGVMFSEAFVTGD